MLTDEISLKKKLIPINDTNWGFNQSGVDEFLLL